MQQPQISIIVPVYNVEQYLNECIESILCQDFADFELLLVDDGSTDSSSCICDSFSKKDTRVKVYHQENKGVSSARNKGLDKATGIYILFADADDYFLQGAFSTLYRLITTSRTDIALCNSIIQDEQCEKKLFSFKNNLSNSLFDDINHFALWGYIFNFSIIDNIRFVDGLAYSEDRLFINSVMLHSKMIAFSNEACYVHRINPTSACASKDLIRKAHHQFYASYEMCKLKKLAPTSETRNYFQYNSRRIARNAIYDLVNNSYSIKDIKLVYTDYKSFFPKYAFLFFYCTYIYLVLVYILKKMIKFILGYNRI